MWEVEREGEKGERQEEEEIRVTTEEQRRKRLQKHERAEGRRACGLDHTFGISERRERGKYLCSVFLLTG